MASSVKWDVLISRNTDAVIDFANGDISGEQFQKFFSGNPNPARCLVRNNGVATARKLARTAVKKRKLA